MKHGALEIRERHALEARDSGLRDDGQLDTACDPLLVRGDVMPARGELCLRDLGREPERPQESASLRLERRAPEAEARRRPELDQRAQRDGLTMEVARVTPVRLERVPDRVA